MKAFADLTEALPEGGRDFSIKDLQNSFHIIPGSISALLTGKQAEEVCKHNTHTHAHPRTQMSLSLSQEGRLVTETQMEATVSIKS